MHFDCSSSTASVVYIGNHRLFVCLRFVNCVWQAPLPKRIMPGPRQFTHCTFTYWPRLNLFEGSTGRSWYIFFFGGLHIYIYIIIHIWCIYIYIYIFVNLTVYTCLALVYTYMYTYTLWIKLHSERVWLGYDLGGQPSLQKKYLNVYVYKYNIYIYLFMYNMYVYDIYIYIHINMYIYICNVM